MNDVGYIDVTKKWIREAKPRKGNIKFLNYTITQDGERFDSTNSILDIIVDDDFYIGTWFKNNIWGNCGFQPAIVLPQNKRSADLRLFGKCPLIVEQTVEIKNIGSKRVDGLIYRLKQAKGQSSNVLLDLTNYSFDEYVVRREIRNYFISHSWIKTVIAKKENNIMFVWQKK